MKKECLTVWMTSTLKDQLTLLAKREKMGRSTLAAELLDDSVNAHLGDKIVVEGELLDHILSILHMNFLLALDGYDPKSRFRHSDSERKELVALYQHRAKYMREALFGENDG